MSPVWISKPVVLRIKEEAISLVVFHYNCIYDRPGSWCSFDLSLCRGHHFICLMSLPCSLTEIYPNRASGLSLVETFWLVTNTAKLPIIFYIGPWKSSYLFVPVESRKLWWRFIIIIIIRSSCLGHSWAYHTIHGDPATKQGGRLEGILCLCRVGWWGDCRATNPPLTMVRWQRAKKVVSDSPGLWILLSG